VEEMLPEDVTMLVANRKRDAGYIEGLADMKVEIRRRLKGGL